MVGRFLPYRGEDGICLPGLLACCTFPPQENNYNSLEPPRTQISHKSLHKTRTLCHGNHAACLPRLLRQAQGQWPVSSHTQNLIQEQDLLFLHGRVPLCTPPHHTPASHHFTYPSLHMPLEQGTCMRGEKGAKSQEKEEGGRQWKKSPSG